MYKLDENFWFKYFQVYDILNQLIPYQNTLEAFVLNIDNNNLKVLDVGCGTGNLACKILNSKKIDSLVGVDYSKIALEIADKKAKDFSNIFFQYCDLNNGLPFENEKFDLVVMNNVLYTIDIDKRGYVLREIYRVLKYGGKVILSNINFKFRPFSIYISHIQQSFKQIGYIKTFIQIFQFLKPTILIFYYNYLIRKQGNGGSYHFMNKGEQSELLTSVGFSSILEDVEVYSGNAYLNVALK